MPNHFPANVDAYLLDGCGRCPLGGTPDCKVHNWTEILRSLRLIIKSCGLEESIKWGAPCYTHKGGIVLMLSALKDRATIGFFKGVLIPDEAGLLEKPGPNSQSVRNFNFISRAQVTEYEPLIRGYVIEAMRIEESGQKVEFPEKNELVYPLELIAQFENDPVFADAFESLTPGRKRGYNLFFSGAKQPATRHSRIEKMKPRIFEGKGMQD